MCLHQEATLTQERLGITMYYWTIDIESLFETDSIRVSSLVARSLIKVDRSIPLAEGLCGLAVAVLKRWALFDFSSVRLASYDQIATLITVGRPSGSVQFCSTG